MTWRVKVEFTKGTISSRGGMHTAWARGGGAVGLALAGAIKRRVQRRGDLGGQQFSGYARKWYRIVDRRYPISGGKLIGNDNRYFENSAEMHASTKPGSYSVSGGMWAGLSLVVGPYSSQIRFRGRSLGQQVQTIGAKAKGAAKDKGKFAGRGSRQASRKVNNALKASSVFTSHKVNLLALAERELDAIGGGLVAGIRKQLTSIGPAAVEYAGGGVHGLIESEIVRRLI